MRHSIIAKWQCRCACGADLAEQQDIKPWVGDLTRSAEPPRTPQPWDGHRLALADDRAAATPEIPPISKQLRDQAGRLPDGEEKTKLLASAEIM